MLSPWLWLLAALLALLGGGAHLVLASRAPARSRHSLRRAMTTLVGVALAGGLAWSLLTSAVWSSAPVALVFLALGALLGASVLASRSASAAHPVVFGLALIGIGLVGGVAGLLAFGDSGPGADPVGRNYLLVARLALAGLGSGVWLAAALASVLFSARRSLEPATISMPEPPLAGRAVDPGRLPAVIGYPLLTAALLAAVLWNLQAYAAAWRTALPDLWLLVTWLLGAAFLHATSSWRPLGLPAWFPSLIAAGACGAAVLSALSAGALLVG